PLEKLPVNVSLPADDAARTSLSLSGSSPLARAWQDAMEFRLRAAPASANSVPIYYSKAPTVVIEQEPNNTPQLAQKVAIPCEVAGQFYPDRDLDWIEFDAKKGQTYWIEVISSQLGLGSDPFFALYRVTKDEKGQEKQSDVAQADDPQERTNRRNPNT